MPDNDEAVTAEATTETENNDTAVESAADAAEQDAVPAETEKLLKALQAERAARKAAETEAKTAKQQLADQSKTAEQIEADQKLRDAEQAALAKANERVVRSELKAAAAGKVKRPDLLLKLVDLSAIPVDDAGDPDPSAVEDAISTFLAEYPELAADAQKFSGTADQGAKGRQSKPQQLTREDIKSLTPEQIVEAEANGQLASLLGGKA